ncbi:MAG TPA: hypothetical protein VGP07_09750 [Polyangia bacterium]
MITLIPRERLNARLGAIGGGQAPVAELVDLGLSYRILAAGQMREYRDERRDCASRARVAAVFVALSIDPAETSPVSPPSARPAPPVAVAGNAPLSVARIDLGVTVQGGFGTNDRVTDVGGELRCSGGRRWFGPAGGITVMLPVDTTVGGLRLRQWRLPVDVGLRVRVPGTRLERYLEVGLSAALLSERALALVDSRSRTALEVGLRVGMGIHAANARFAPFASLSAELVPHPPSVFALPVGTAGHTPSVWIGATAGLSLSFL